MSRKLILFLLIFFVFPFSKAIAANITQGSGEMVRNDSVEVMVLRSGVIEVVESIAYDFGNLNRHGIYRKIPYIKTNSSGKKFAMSIDVVSVTNERGNFYNYSSEKNSGIISIKIGDPDRTVNGLKTYVIKYRVSGALTYFSDHDELYWNITGNEWEVPILESSAQVVLPDSLGSGRVNVACFTGYKGSTEKLCRMQLVQNKVLVLSEKNFPPGQGLTAIVAFPKSLVAVLEPKEEVDFFSAPFGKIVVLLLLLLGFFWYIILPFYLPLKWYFQGRDPSLNQPYMVWYDPPKTTGGRLLTSAETGTLIDETANNRDIYSSVVDLARRGYLKIVEKKKGDFYLVRLKDFDNDTGLINFEKRLLSGIFHGEVEGDVFELLSLDEPLSKDLEKKVVEKSEDLKGEIRVKDKKLYQTVESVKKKIYLNLVSEGFFPENPEKVRKFYLGTFLGLSLITFNVPLIISLVIFGKNMPRKTKFGVQQSFIAKSLRNFLNSQERQLTFEADKQMIFEKLLPYAIAFGVEKIWAKRFADFNLVNPDWYQGYDQSAFNSGIFISHLNSSFSTMAAAMTPTVSSSGFSSGFSGGGGSSGGGGGGGGGGSW